MDDYNSSLGVGNILREQLISPGSIDDKVSKAGICMIDHGSNGRMTEFGYVPYANSSPGQVDVDSSFYLMLIRAATNTNGDQKSSGTANRILDEWMPQSE